MKLVTAVIQPFKLEQVQNALTQIGVSGMTITEVEGFGNQKGHNETDRDAVYAVGFVPKVEIEVAVPANLVENVIDVILRSARTGEIGDGKIFVTDIDHATRIRTVRMMTRRWEPCSSVAMPLQMAKNRRFPGRFGQATSILRR